MHYTFIFILFISIATAQINYKTIQLPKTIEETSGLEYFGDYLLTHNDSGDKPTLYVFSDTGKMVQAIRIYGIKNKDWEDITSDSNHYYVSDTGNNVGTRENLTVYILNKELIPQGKIKIKYEAQTTFSRDPRTPYDAEAIASVGDQLVLFSKNRKTFQSQIYRFPKTEGTYNLSPEAILETESLITAADYNEAHDLVALTGYTYKGEQFFYTLTDFVKNGMDQIQLKKYPIPIGKAQVEAVKIIDDRTFWVSSESEQDGIPKLYQLELEP